jgi:transposase
MSEANQAGWMSLGIDVAKAKFDVALLRPEKLTRHTFAMDATGFAALASWVRQQGAVQVHACLEATGEYGRVRGSLGSVPL